MFVTYFDVGEMLPVARSQGNSVEGKPSEIEVTSNIIGASIGNRDTSRLPEPVNFTIRLDKVSGLIIYTKKCNEEDCMM